MELPEYAVRYVDTHESWLMHRFEYEGEYEVAYRDLAMFTNVGRAQEVCDKLNNAPASDLDIVVNGLKVLEVLGERFEIKADPERTSVLALGRFIHFDRGTGEILR